LVVVQHSDRASGAAHRSKVVGWMKGLQADLPEV
jgi:hypothetical protein